MKKKNKIIIGISIPFILFALLCLIGQFVEPPPTTPEEIEKTNKEISEKARVLALGKDIMQSQYDSWKERSEMYKTLRNNAQTDQEHTAYDNEYKKALRCAETIKNDAAKANFKLKD